MDDERRRELKKAFKRAERDANRSALILDERQLLELLDYLDDRLAHEDCDSRRLPMSGQRAGVLIRNDSGLL